MIEGVQHAGTRNCSTIVTVTTVSLITLDTGSVDLELTGESC